MAQASFLGYFQSYISEDLSGPRDQVANYWRIYGGWSAVWKSPALWISILLTGLCYPFWKNGTWSDTTLSIVPNLLGFSLGAMAVVLAFPTSYLFGLFAEGGRKDSYYMDLASKFVHFIFIQAIAIILALLGKAYCFILISMFGFLFLAYAITSVAMTALALFDVAQISNETDRDSGPANPL